MGWLSMHYLSMLFYPLSEGLTMKDAEAPNKYMVIVNLGAMLLVIVFHAIVSFVGALVATLLSESEEWKNSTTFKYQFLFIGLLFTYASRYNLENLIRPDWFKIDLLFYLPAAYLGYKLVAKRA